MTMARSQSRPLFKILLIGDTSVGKTCLLCRFADNKFNETFTSTIGIDFRHIALSVRDKTVDLQLWDTAGQEKFLSITRSYYRSANAVILVYDRTDARSFQNITRWMKNIDDCASENVLRVLVANKSDIHHRIVISTQDGKELADKYNVDFFETSAKSDSIENIAKIFRSITEKLLENYQPLPQPSPNPIIRPKDRLDSTYEKLISCC